MTHFIVHDEPRIGRRQHAVCGALVDPKSHANEPSCPECQATLASLIETIEGLRAL